MTLYDIDNIPVTKTWIRALTKEQAIAQCEAVGLRSHGQLEDLRVRLREYFYPGPNSDETAIESDTAKLFEQAETAVPPVESVPPAPVEQPISIIADPAVQALIKSMQVLTTQAIAETARALAPHITPHSTDHNHSFHLPSIAQQMLNELQIVNESDPIKLIKFLAEIDKILALKLAPEHSILAHVIPLTRDRLRTFWLQAQAQNLDWKRLQAFIKSNLFTSRSIREAQDKLLFRKQGDNETFSHFVTEINAFFQFLAPDFDSKEKFETVFTGLNERSRFSLAGLPVPGTVEDLLKLSPMIDSIAGDKKQDDSTVHQNHQHTQPYKFRTYNNNNGNNNNRNRQFHNNKQWGNRFYHNQNRQQSTQNNQAPIAGFQNVSSHGTYNAAPHIPPFPQQLANMASAPPTPHTTTPYTNSNGRTQGNASGGL